MSDVVCAHCGAASPSGAAFCGACGTPFKAPAPAAVAPPGPGAYPPQPPAGYPPAPQGYAPTPPGYPPAGGAYPAYPSATKVIGTNTKWGIGLGVASLFLVWFAPLASGAGAFMAKKDVDDIAAGRAPQLNEGWAKGVFYVDMVLTALALLGVLLLMGRGCAI